VFDKAEDNDSDLLTENFNKDTYEKHAVNSLGKIDACIDVKGKLIECDLFIYPLRIVIL
jgi:hypothetical protein